MLLHGVVSSGSLRLAVSCSAPVEATADQKVRMTARRNVLDGCCSKKSLC